jgi:alkanesulfonate monooxygenase SsuD/methylene tetrahydromethanopterin reductase-like flavin-dependent oxidoreductase (luciferase family)
VVTGLWTTPPGETFSHHGTHYRLDESPALPKPVQSPRPPVIVGGKGPRRTPALAARFADEFNIPFESADFATAQFERVRQACSAAGRDPASMRFSNALILACGRDDAEVDRRLDAIGQTRESMEGPGLCGTPDELVDRIGRYAEAGATRIYLQTLDLADLDHLELVASAVVPQLG